MSSAAALLEPSPQSAWPLAFQRALEDARSEGFFVASLSIPDQTGALTDFHYSDTAVADDDLGQIRRQVVGWPDIMSGVDPVVCRLLGVQMYELRVEDPDGDLSAALAGSSASGISRAAIVFRAATTATRSRLWPVIFRGLVVDWRQLGRQAIGIRFRRDDVWLLRPLARELVTRAAWPAAHVSVIGQRMPLAVGYFNVTDPSQGRPTLYVDTGNWIFLYHRGSAWDVNRVALNGVEAATTDYSIVYATVDGLDYTGIQWLSDPGADPDVRVLESFGYATSADANSGSHIETLPAQLRTLLVNFGWGSWRSGSTWLDASLSPLDLSSWAEWDDRVAGNMTRPRLPILGFDPIASSEAAPFGRRHARFVNSAVSGLDLLAEACRQTQARPYWTDEGKLAIAFLDPKARVRFVDGPFWIRDEDSIDQGGLASEDLRLTPAARIDCGDLAATVPAADPWAASERLPARWSAPLSEAGLVPYVTTDEPVAWTVTGGSNPHEAIDDPFRRPDDDVSVATWDDGATAVGTFRIRLRWSSDGPEVPAARTVQRLRLYWRAKYVDGGNTTHTMKVGVRVNGTTYFGSVQTLTTNWESHVDEWLLNPDTGLAWTMDAIAQLEAEVSAEHVAGQDHCSLTQLFGWVSFQAVGSDDVSVREALAERASLQAWRPQVTVATVGLHKGFPRPMQFCSISSDSPPSSDGVGWGVESWQRRPHVMISKRWRMDSPGSVELRMLDVRVLAHSIFETGVALSSAPEASGVIRAGAWASGRSGQPDGRRFARLTDHTDGDPTGVSTVSPPGGGSDITVGQDTERYEGTGSLMLRAQIGAGPATAKDVLLYENAHDAAVLAPERGYTFFFRLSPTGINDPGQRTVYRCGSDVVFFDVDTESITFRRSVAGSDHDATIAAVALSSGFWGAARVTSRDQELTRLDAEENEEAVPRYTLSLFVRNSSQDESATADSVEGFIGPLYVGSDAGADQAEKGLVWWRAIGVLTDDEVASELQRIGGIA